MIRQVPVKALHGRTAFRQLVLSSCLLLVAGGVWAADISVSWDNPPQNSDGTPLTELSGFRVYSGRQSGVYDQVTQVAAAPAILRHLQDGQRYFIAVTAVAATGLESAHSQEVVWDVPQVPTVVLPVLAVATQAVSLARTATLMTPSARVAVWNAGGGQLAYTVSEGAAWLNCSPKSGISTGQQQQITFSATTVALTAGTYHTAVEISTATQTQRVEVALHVPANAVGGTAARDLLPAAPLDFDGDVRSDFVVYDSATGRWRVRGSEGRDTALTFGDANSLPLADDYDGDLVTDYALYEPALGRWLVVSSRDGSMVNTRLGDARSVPVPADYDGDGKADLAVFDPESSGWDVLLSSDGSRRTGTFGPRGAAPVPADFDGDGKADIVVFDRATALWTGRLSATAKRFSFNFGMRNALPVAADFDGDGVADGGTYSPETGLWRIRYSSTGQAVDRYYGWAGTVPVPADYDGDGVADLGVYDSKTGMWFVWLSTGGDVSHWWGGSTCRPVSVQYQINRTFGWCQ